MSIIAAQLGAFVELFRDCEGGDQGYKTGRGVFRHNCIIYIEFVLLLTLLVPHNHNGKDNRE